MYSFCYYNTQCISRVLFAVSSVKAAETLQVDFIFAGSTDARGCTNLYSASGAEVVLVLP